MPTTVETFKENVRARLDALGVTAYQVSRGAGESSPWLNTILLPSRYSKKISSDLIDRVAKALGVPAHELIDPKFNPLRRKAPGWVKEEE
jgi:transcriptional regulator with XRE-family HTH domain